jgi:hypothetical protein
MVSRLLVGAKGVRLPFAAVEGEHELCPQPLVEGMSPHQGI